jgi:isoquinoline 1-oxidoreductase beta subunit
VKRSDLGRIAVVYSVEATRRSFLQASALAGGGLLVALYLPSCSRQPGTGDEQDTVLEPNAFVRITPDNRITVVVGHSELGQGALTAISMLVAEELDADWDRVRYEQAPTDPAYNQPVFQHPDYRGEHVHGIAIPAAASGRRCRPGDVIGRCR